MARLSVKANITAPQEINIPLVRADHHQTSGIFRICFEVSLSLFSTLLGYLLSKDNPSPIHFIGLAVTAISGAAFLWLTYSFSRKSREV